MGARLRGPRRRLRATALQRRRSPVCATNPAGRAWRGPLSRQGAAIPGLEEAAKPTGRDQPFGGRAAIAVAVGKRERKIGRRAGPAVVHRIDAESAGVKMIAVTALRR